MKCLNWPLKTSSLSPKLRNPLPKFLNRLFNQEKTMKKQNKKVKKELTVEQKISRRNFISFTSFAVLAAGAFEGWRWLYKSPEEITGITGGTRKPLRRALNKTELFFRRTVFSENHLVKTYPK